MTTWSPGRSSIVASSLSAALVLGQAWIAAGRPAVSTRTIFGGYESWTKVLGGVLELAEVPGFLENRRLLFEQADSENAEIRAFLWSWWSMHHQELVLVRTLLPLAREHALPIESRTDHGMLVKLGLLIQSIADREYALGDWHVRVVRGHTGTGSASGAVKWRLKPVVENGSSRGEHVSGSVGSIGSLFQSPLQKSSEFIYA